jgi:hypothetical protein
MESKKKTKIHLDEDEEYEPGDIVSKSVICQGPPRCTLEHEDALIEQMDGCVWCKRFYIDRMGREYVYEPGEA